MIFIIDLTIREGAQAVIQKPQKPRFRGAEIQKKFLGENPQTPLYASPFQLSQASIQTQIRYC